jgi:hypothetical protein
VKRWGNPHLESCVVSRKESDSLIYCLDLPKGCFENGIALGMGTASFSFPSLGKEKIQ